MHGKERNFLSQGRKGHQGLQQEDQSSSCILSQWKSNQICWTLKKKIFLLQVFFQVLTKFAGVCTGKNVTTCFLFCLDYLPHGLNPFLSWEKKNKKTER